MTLETLQKDMIQAMKDKDTLKKSVLSAAIGAIKNAAIARKCRDNVPSELVIEVLLKEKKTLQEQIDTCPDNRLEMKKEFLAKMGILKNYCPKLIDDPAEIEMIIRNLTSRGDCHINLAKSNRGVIMKTIVPHFKGKADMKVVNETLNTILK